MSTPLNPEAHADVVRMRDMVAEAIDNPGESVHEFVSLPDLYRLLERLAVAQQDSARALAKAHSDAGWLENIDRQGGA